MTVQSDEDAALDWIVGWVSAQDWAARDHYFHICEGKADTCSCTYVGEK